MERMRMKQVQRLGGNENGLVFLVSGPVGAGKTTVARGLAERPLPQPTFW